MKRFSIFLKDGRTASVDGTKIDPNIDRPFLGQARGFIIVTADDDEVAVFLATDVIGWTVEPGAESQVDQNGWGPTVVRLPVEASEESVEAAAI